MNSWDDIDRHMGPSEPAPEASVAGGVSVPPPAFEIPTPLQAEGAPSAGPIYEPLRTAPPVVLPAVVPSPEPEPNEWTTEDEFNPRYCPGCHHKIPIIVSERQEYCNACLAARNVAVQPLPVTGAPYVDAGPPQVHCPMCASANVEREWKNDWVSAAVDIVSDAAAIGTMLLSRGNMYGMFGSRRGLDWNHEAGPVKTMRHRCLNCGHTWVE